MFRNGHLLFSSAVFWCKFTCRFSYWHASSVWTFFFLPEVSVLFSLCLWHSICCVSWNAVLVLRGRYARFPRILLRCNLRCCLTDETAGRAVHQHLCFCLFLYFCSHVGLDALRQEKKATLEREQQEDALGHDGDDLSSYSNIFAVVRTYDCVSQHSVIPA